MWRERGRTMPHAEINGIQVYYEVHGNGPNMALIEGLGYDCWMWYRQMPAFADHFRVLIYDNRGVGRSDAPPGPYSHEENASDLQRSSTIWAGIAHMYSVSLWGASSPNNSR